MPPAAAPEPIGVPAFAPLRVRTGWQRLRLRRAMRRRRRALAAGLAVTAAALAAWGPRAPVGTVSSDEPVALRQHRPPVEVVSAPVRIADAETVRLLRPGDRVDVIAAADSPADSAAEARVIAAGARVADVPRSHETHPDGGALIVLSVPRPVAAALASIGATSRLAVTLC